MRVMGNLVDFKDCQGWANHASPPDGVKCPPDLTYQPSPPSPIEMPFIGWNPPGTTQFWNSSTDKLRTNLKWILSQEPFCWKQQDFLNEFLSRGCYLVHAARCWADSAWPPVEVAQTCARALLSKDIQILRPRRICIFGKIPLYAAREVIAGLPHPEEFAYQKGSCVEVGEMRVIVTVLPHHYDRKYTLEALRRWWT